MKLLLTGGSGYIGSHTAYCLLQNLDCEIVILDNFSTGFRENFLYLQAVYPKRVRLVTMDLGDLAGLEMLLGAENVDKKGFDAVLHFGASLIVSESVEKPLLYYKNNVINTINLIDLCIKHKIKNFIFSSTAAVYGEPDSSLIPVKESAPLLPINPYGSSKMMSEMVMRDVSAVEDFCYIALRYFNVAGSSMANNPKDLSQNLGLGQRAKNATHLIKIATQCATHKRDEMFIFGDDYPTPDGTCIRDYIHIDDLASAHLVALEFLLQHKKSEIFNVGYNQGYSVKEVIDCVKKVSGVDFCVKNAPRRDGDPAMLIASNERLLSLTHWKPRYNDLELIVKSAYEWERFLK